MPFPGFGPPASAWRAALPTLLVRQDAAAKAVSSAKVAGFDLNDTLVGSKTGAPGYQVTVSDWKMYTDAVPGKLRELHKDGFKIVVFTNQGNIRSALEGKRAQAVKAYIDAFLKECDVPVLVLAATAKDRLRKPMAGMWEEVEKLNGGVAIDRQASFYVGDAAGNLGEHSADDLEFAKAVGVSFTHAKDYFGKGDSASRLTPTVERLVNWRLPPGSPKPAPPLVLVLVGAPGCGKTTFGDKLGPPAPKPSAKVAGAAVSVGREGESWRRVSQDLLGTKEACLKAAAASLEQGLSVVVDRTNFNAPQRSDWLALAAQHKADCHCVVFDMALEELYRRVNARKNHEGKVQGGSVLGIVGRLYQQLDHVKESEAFSRIRRVRTNEEVDAELAAYGAKPFAVAEHGPTPEELPAKRPVTGGGFAETPAAKKVCLGDSAVADAAAAAPAAAEGVGSTPAAAAA